MRMSRHWLFITGGAFMIAAVAALGLSMSSAGPVSAGNGTFEPTIDPCLILQSDTGSDVAALQAPECVTETQGPPRTHTPTPEPTDPPTQVVDTSTPAPTQPPATNTPTGGSQGGGVQPPDTGFGPDGGDGGGLWLLLAAAALAAAGAGATAAGFRSR